MRNAKFLVLIPALLLCAAPALSQAAIGIGIGVSVNIAPPVLPVYAQPELPAPGYLWTPGYWAWDGGANDYYWVPGAWVEPPSAELLWTPGYWGWNNGAYLWNAGYWGPQVGFYGGVNYGYGYTGVGFAGGYWHGGAFFYNRAVANFGHVNIVNVYNTPVERVAVSRVSFNGGEGGIRAQPTSEQRAFMSQHHVGATSMQRQQEQHAMAMPAMHRGQNGGRPAILTTQRAGDFSHPGPGLNNHQAHGGQGPQHGAAMTRGPQQDHGQSQDHGQPQDRGDRGGAPPDQHAQVQDRGGPQGQPHAPAHEQAPHPQPQHEERHEDH